MDTIINAQAASHGSLWLILIAILWVLPWKGVAMWKAARLSHKKWFIAILIVNTFGILEMIYIFFIARKYKVETEEKLENGVEIK